MRDNSHSKIRHLAGSPAKIKSAQPAAKMPSSAHISSGDCRAELHHLGRHDRRADRPHLCRRPPRHCPRRPRGPGPRPRSLPAPQGEHPMTTGWPTFNAAGFGCTERHLRDAHRCRSGPVRVILGTKTERIKGQNTAPKMNQKVFRTPPQRRVFGSVAPERVS